MKVEWCTDNEIRTCIYWFGIILTQLSSHCYYLFYLLIRSKGTRGTVRLNLYWIYLGAFQLLSYIKPNGQM